jgi:ubiquinone/menaquinone biosynthesis C-methylase UbiE
MDEMASYKKPEGKSGEELLDLMDHDHTPIALWSLKNLKVNEKDVTLDIGCGSGLNIKRLFEKSPNAKSFGVDYSSTSVKKSKQLNKELVDKGCVEIYEANVLDMPFEDKMFDIITAFETVYFWPDIITSFKEVKRILKDDGKFFIVMDANGCYTPELEEITKEENCTFYTDEELKDLLLNADFSKVTSIVRLRKKDQKCVKKWTKDNFCKKILDDNYQDDQFVEFEEDGFPSSPEWYCIIAQK